MDVRRISLLLRDWMVTALQGWQHACCSTIRICPCSALPMTDECKSDSASYANQSAGHCRLLTINWFKLLQQVPRQMVCKQTW